MAADSRSIYFVSLIKFKGLFIAHLNMDPGEKEIKFKIYNLGVLPVAEGYWK